MQFWRKTNESTVVSKKTWIAVLTVGLLVATMVPGWFSTAQASSTSNPKTSLSVDGSSSSFCDHSTNSCTTALSTSKTNDAIVVYTIEILDLQTSCTFSVSDTASLSWNSRSVIVFGRGGRDQLQEFWAQSTVRLSSDLITESIIGCASTFGGEYNGLNVVAVSGTTISNPFDSNGQLPATASGSSTTASVSVSTASRTDMIIAGVRMSGNVAAPGTGFTLITSTDGGQDAVESMLIHRPGSNLSVAFTGTNIDSWMIIADALH